MTTSPSERPTREVPLDPETGTSARPKREKARQGLPQVVVSTSDPGALQRLGLRLFGRAEVLPVRSTLELKRRARVSERCVVVLDCAAPELDPLDVATALSVVGSPTVVVWGASPAMKAELAASADSARWVHVGVGTSPAELAELLSSLC